MLTKERYKKINSALEDARIVTGILFCGKYKEMTDVRENCE